MSLAIANMGLELRKSFFVRELDFLYFNSDTEAWLDERFLKSGHDIEQEVSGFNGYTNHYPFVPRGYTTETVQIYGYAGHDQNTVDVLKG